MRLVHISYSDSAGGAARAAYRCFESQRKLGLDAKFLCRHKGTGDPLVETFSHSPIGKILDTSIRPAIGKSIARFLGARNPNELNSVNILPSRINWNKTFSNADIVTLHWIAGECLSIEDIGRIEKPTVWRLPDMWPFLGSEHYLPSTSTGSFSPNRTSIASKLTWRRKVSQWRKPFHIVCTTRWLAAQVRLNPFMKDWPISIIPNALDTDVWAPVDRGIARSILGLPTDSKVVLFGALGGALDPRKGANLLKDALSKLRQWGHEIHLVIFGEKGSLGGADYGFTTHYAGHLGDDLSLRIIYSCADVMVVPSRQEAFGQTASEAQACGVPVVAFENTGVADIVLDRETGRLAENGNSLELAKGIEWVLSEAGESMRTKSREAAVSRFSYSTISEAYLHIYKELLR